MEGDENSLINRLLAAGISREAIRAAWPSWWHGNVGASPSGRAELRFALARRLGLEPQSLLGERVEFIWSNEAKFKNLSTQSAEQQAALTSFGVTLGRLLIRATPADQVITVSALDLRKAILAGSHLVDLTSLLGACWAMRIPVVSLRVFPLEAKAMHAMVVRVDGRYAVLLGRDANYPAPVAFTLAHELGHIMLGHLDNAPALIDFEDPSAQSTQDEHEAEADGFALTLLTGSATPVIETTSKAFNAPTLAAAAIKASGQYAIEPGTLALCLAFTRKIWPLAMAAQRFIYQDKKPVWREVNAIASSELSFDSITDEAAGYLRTIMGQGDA